MIASHNSVEPGHNIMLKLLDLEPMLQMKMRLGEGTGAALAINLVEAACKILNEMATFAEAGRHGKNFLGGPAMSLQDVLAALGVIINALPGGLYAMTFGFASVPTSIGFAIGAIGCGLLGVVSPISFQAETLTLAGTMGRNIQERLSIVFWEGAFLLVIGLLGLFKVIVAFIGPVITSGMMAGVGIILARVAVEMTHRNPVIGGVSIVTALLTYYLVPNPAEKLVYAIVRLRCRFLTGQSVIEKTHHAGNRRQSRTLYPPKNSL